jgi:hypothetical protein
MDSVPDNPWGLISLDAFTRPPEAMGDSVRKDLRYIYDRLRYKSEMSNPVIARSDVKAVPDYLLTRAVRKPYWSQLLPALHEKLDDWVMSETADLLIQAIVYAPAVELP